METVAKTKQSSSEVKNNSLAGLWWFLIPSLLGMILFIVPVRFDDTYTIVVAIMANILQKSITWMLPTVIFSVIFLSFMLGISQKIFPNLFKNRQSILYRLGQLNLFWLIVRALAFIFSFMVLTKVGFDAVISSHTGGVLLNELLPTIFCVFLFAGLLLPFLLDFGLLEFFGVLASKIMRPLFTLPGRSSIDCLASWLGDGTIGVLLTNKQYVEGYYTAREAAVIATTFSFVSLSFSLVILAQLQLMAYIIPYYATMFLAGIVCAVIMPRIPPLSKKPDEFYPEVTPSKDSVIPTNYSPWQWALKCALERAQNHLTITETLKLGFANVVEMWVGVIPIVMAFGTCALIVAEYTPLFKWLGLPFVPILQLLAIPHAQELSQAVVIGFADMFLPAVLSSELPSEMARFVVATLSISQLIFMSEVGGLMLGSNIPVKFRDLIYIFVIRTLISLPIIAAVAHMIF